MALRKNLNRCKPGSIYRISLENFVTFKQMELYPGQSLNMIIGPNGTGKSTFVCAIILGLCGKASVIGRAKTIGEYVKSGYQQATIEIELYQKPGEDNVTITRSFNLENNSLWSINSKPAKLKQVQEIIESLDIQVDNLCQLLPQDRVQDFAKMNSQQLLKSTQIAISGQKAVSLLEELIETRISHRSLSSKLTSSTQQLQEQETLNSRIKGAIISMNEIKRMEEEIEISLKKKLWAEYELSKANVDNLIKDKGEAEKLMKIHRHRMEPLEQIVAASKANITQLENSKLNSTREMTALKNKIRQTIEMSTNQDAKIEDLETELSMKIDQHESRHRNIMLAKTVLVKLESDKNVLYQTYGDENTVKDQMAQLQNPISKTNKAIVTLKNTRGQLQFELDSKQVPQLRLCENRLNTITNIANKRLEILQNINEHTYRAVLWLRDNKQMFHGNVYEPIVLELNFSDPRYACYLENCVSARDLIAFTFESSEDMNKFLKIVRSDLNLKQVNAVCSPPSREQFTAPIPIDQLRPLGFQTYLREVISAPDAIIRFLCKLYAIHKIPIGNENTYRLSAKVPANITLFFTEKHRFVIKVSSYSGAKSTTSNEVRPAKLLSNTLDQDMLSQCQTQLSEFKALVDKSKTDIKHLDGQVCKLEESINGLITKRKKLHETIEQFKTISSRLRMQQNKIANLENEQYIDIEAEKDKCKRDVAVCVKKQCNIQKDIHLCLKTYQNKLLNSNVLVHKLATVRKAVLEQQTELRELKNKAAEVEHLLDDMVRRLSNAKTAAREKLNDAMTATGGVLPHEAKFPYTEQFLKLPSDLQSLQVHIAELQTKIECMDGADNQLVTEYEDREKLIKTLKQDTTKMLEQSKSMESKMQDIRGRWLVPLEEQVLQIDQRFGNMFAQMGCSGEVKISKPGGEDDYDKYGISILVRFRENEQLQQLSPFTQSGGERTLSTALYLMALQQLSKVPFRCVDEINQGMDPINERKMFQLLVKLTTERENWSQYFLLTPKLIPDLEYTDSIKVHTIENGPRIFKYSKWTLKKFIASTSNIKHE